MNTSPADLILLDDDTLSGRAQIRSILHEGYGVPDEIVDWIFERFDKKNEHSHNLISKLRSWEYLF